MRLPLWPRSLRGQMIALVLIGLVMAQLLGFGIFRWQHEHMLRSLREEDILVRVASVVRLLAETPVEVHPRILHAVSTPWLRFSIALEPARDPGPARHPSAPLRQQLAARLDTDSANIRIERQVIAPAGESSPPRRPQRPSLWPCVWPMAAGSMP